MAVTIFRGKVAMGFNTTIRNGRFRVFASFAHASDEGDYKFDWKDAVNLALNENEVAELADALHTFNTGNEIDGVFFHHESQREDASSKELKVGHPRNKDKTPNTYSISIWLDEVTTTKSGKTKPLKTGGIITLTKGEALFLEKFLTKSLDYYVYDMIENSVNYAANNGGDKSSSDDDGYSSEDIPDVDSEDEDEDYDPFA